MYDMATTSSLQLSDGPHASPPEYAVAWGERELSAVTLPTAMGKTPHAEQLHLKHQLEHRPCRKVRTTRVFTVPSQQAAPVRVWSPKRPPTEQRLHHRRACAQLVAAGKEARARSAKARNGRPARPQLRPRPNTAGNPSGTTRASEARLEESPLATRPCQLFGGHNINGAAQDYHRGAHPHPLFINREDVDIKRGQPRWPLAKQPRAMSASARGRAISRVVDSWCKSLPTTPGFSSGAPRFLQQWDRATRTQREELLYVLADRLLDGRNHSDPSARPHKNIKVGRPPVDFHRHAGRQCTGVGGVAGGGSDNVCQSGPSGNEGSHQAGIGDSLSHPRDIHKELLAVGAVAHTERDVNSAEAEHNPYQGNAPTTARKATGTSDVAGFLELLGPYAGLLATRVTSQLISSYAGGHAVGPCLRVCALLAEPTTGQGVVGDVDDGCNMHSTSGPSPLGHQLCTPEVLSTALEIAAASPRERVVVGDSRPKTKMAKRARRRPVHATTKTAPILPSPPTEHDEQHQQLQEEEEHDRREALRLLLALVRVGGRRVKEYLTSPGRPLLPRPTDTVAVLPLGSGDAFDRIVMALRRPACRSDVRIAGARLLAELGLESQDRSAGDSCERVWNAVLCLLSGVGDEDPAEGHILGCRIAFDLLAASPKLRGNHGGDRASGRNALLEESISDQHKPWQRQRLMRPELRVLPSILSLTLSDSCGVREAAGKLAVLLVTEFPRPCCYLLVACLVGLFGLVSGVERGAPTAWIQHRHQRQSRCGDSVETHGTHDDDLQNQGAEDRSEVEDPGYEQDLEGGCRQIDLCRTVRTHNIPEGNRIVRGQSSRAEGPEQESSVDSARGRGSGERSPSTPKSSSGSSIRTISRADRSAADNRDTAGHGDKAVFALDLLRRVCAEGRGGRDDNSTRLALAHALAPLAALDLIMGPARPAADLSSRDAGDAATTEADIDGNAVFVTQAEDRAATTGAACSENGESHAGGDSPRFLRDDDQLRSGGNQRLLYGGPQSFSLRSDRERGCSGVECRLAGRRRCGRAQPTEALCRSVAEALLAMYRGGRSGRAADAAAGQPGALDPDDMIDAAVDDCPTLSRGLSDGHSEVMARVFSSSCCSTSRGGGNSGDSINAELRTLRRNMVTLTARLGRVRPPPPPPVPPPPPPVPDDASPRSRAGCDGRSGLRHLHHWKDNREDGAIGRTTTMLSENEWYAETPVSGSSDRGDDGWRAVTTEREALFAGEGPRAWMEPGAEGTSVRRTHAAGGGDDGGHPPLGTQLASAATAAAALLRRRQEHQQQRRQQQRPRGPRVIAVTSRKAAEATGTVTAANGAAHGSGDGPRLWSPEDWEDSPTMAMLTEPGAREGESPQMKDGEKPGPIWRAAFGGERGPPATAAEVRATLLTKGIAVKNSDGQGGPQQPARDATPAGGTPKKARNGVGGSPQRDAAEAPTTRTTTVAPPQDRAAGALLKRHHWVAAAGQRTTYRGRINGRAESKRAGSPERVRAEERNTRTPGSPKAGPGRARAACGVRRPKTAVGASTPTRRRPASSPNVRAPSSRRVPNRQAKRPQQRGGGGRGGRGGEGEGKGPHREGVSQEGAASPELSPLLSLLRLSSSAIPPSRKRHSGTGIDWGGGDGGGGIGDSRRHDGDSATRLDTWKGELRTPQGREEARWYCAPATTAAAPALQTMRIVKGAFEVAERCATTAVGRYQYGQAVGRLGDGRDG